MLSTPSLDLVCAYTPPVELVCVVLGPITAALSHCCPSVELALALCSFVPLNLSFILAFLFRLLYYRFERHQRHPPSLPRFRHSPPSYVQLYVSIATAQPRVIVYGISTAFVCPPCRLLLVYKRLLTRSHQNNQHSPRVLETYRVTSFLSRFERLHAQPRIRGLLFLSSYLPRS